MPVMVGELFEHSTGSWKKELVLNYFEEEEAKLILGLPISLDGCHDKLIWHYSRNGEYTVRSGYGVAMDLQANGELDRKGTGMGSRSMVSDRVWQDIDVDAVKGVDFLESWKKIVARFKDEAVKLSHIEWDRPSDPKILTEAVKDELLQEVVFGLSRIWKCRNALVFEGTYRTPKDAIVLSRSHIQEFRNAQPEKTREKERCWKPSTSVFAGQQVRWKRPSFGTLKINCDGAWRGKSMLGGYGWVLRDFARLLHMAGRVRGEFFNDAAMVEAAAIRAALVVCRDMHYEMVEIESDALSLINMINGECSIDANLECFIFYIQNLVSQIREVKFMHVQRSGNLAAHAMTSYATWHGGSFMWNAYDSEFLFNILAEDVNVSIII
ncbi:uncharacterized protein [Malus domestica]|uniref:uncharacterized protein n=1 Tax=Malus domestica TaxID=3750 RepID=UPI000498F503|nr:uncharacterized protein LOC103454919 [Malus domestica]